MTITPRHGRQFCEARFEKTELYSEKDKFTHDAEKEYGHVSNALLLLRLGKRCVFQFYEMFYRNMVVSKIFCSKASFHKGGTPLRPINIFLPNFEKFGIIGKRRFSSFIKIGLEKKIVKKKILWALGDYLLV